MKVDTFYPIPIAAMTDTRLSATDFRVLGAIAKHDRMGRNGRGCFATHKTLAEIARCSLRSVERSVSNLHEWGIVRSERSNSDGRRIVLRLVYDEIPARPVGENDQNTRQAETEYPPTRNGVRHMDQRSSDGKQRDKQIPINGKAGAAEAAPLLRSRADPLETDPQEWVRRINNGASIGHYLRTIEGAMKGMIPPRRDAHADVLFQLLDVKLSHGETDYHWAERLMNELDYLNAEDGYRSEGTGR